MENIQVNAQMISNDLCEIVHTSINIKVVGLDSNNNMIYSYTLPKHIYDNMVDVEPEYQSYQNYMLMKRDYVKSGKTGIYGLKYLKKTIESNLISTILSTILFYSNYIHEQLHKKELLKTKKIFIRFKGAEHHSRCDWNGAYTGKVINTNFQYFIGYEIAELEKISMRNFTDSNSVRNIVENYYTLILHSTGSLVSRSTNFQEGSVLMQLYMNQNRKEFLLNHSIIDWTQEREDFFKKIQNQLTSLNTSLTDYLCDLDNDKVDLIMTKTILLI